MSKIIVVSMGLLLLAGTAEANMINREHQLVVQKLLTAALAAHDPQNCRTLGDCDEDGIPDSQQQIDVVGNCQMVAPGQYTCDLVAVSGTNKPEQCRQENIAAAIISVYTSIVCMLNPILCLSGITAESFILISMYYDQCY